MIRTLADWQRLGPTEGKWADGYSAKEMARLWLVGDGAEAVRSALRPVLPDLRIENAVAEAMVSFDSYEGGVRNHDVLANAHTADGQALVGVEGKVNESLGARIKSQYRLAERTKAQGPGAVPPSGAVPARSRLWLLGPRRGDPPRVG